MKNILPVKKSLASSAYLAALDAVRAEHPEIASAITQELRDQRTNLKLIASENFSSLLVQLAMGNLLTDKYSEGYPGHRFYAGCDNVDTVESLAVAHAKKLFNADHAYVQPHSGADANLVAYWSVLLHKVEKPALSRLGKKTLEELSAEDYETLRRELVSQKILGLSLGSGGHLTHGFRRNVSSKFFQAISYDVDPKTGLIDYKELEKQAVREKPLILIAGYSAYPRLLDFAKMREIADKAGAVLMVDMAHFAGLVAGKVLTGNFDPIPFAQIVTSTTHKTLRGPRGGLVLCKEELRETVDKGCPLVLGGPLPHVMAAKAIAFKEALAPPFRDYAAQIVKNAHALAHTLSSLGVKLLTGGTDNHLMVLNVAESFGITGMQAEKMLRAAHLTVNRNSIPNDPNGAWHASGVRIGTPAVTSLGMKEKEMQEIGQILYEVLKGKETTGRVQNLLNQFPLYPEIPNV